MMQTIHPQVLTNLQHTEFNFSDAIKVMLEHGSPFEKAMAIAYKSLDTFSRRRLLNEMSHVFLPWMKVTN
jgi:hypothetical protein